MASITLNKFVAREYQKPIIEAYHKGFKRIIAIMPRRAGKDLLCWNLMIEEAIKTVGIYFYCLPTYRGCRIVIFDSLTNNGERFIDYIPKELIKSINQQEMKIRLTNGSLIQLIGSDNYDHSLVGSNCRFIVFSEWAISDERAYTFARPILSANDGIAIFITTPRGKNHAWQMFEMAKQNENWFAYKQTLDDTKHVSVEEIEKIEAEGLMSRDLINQEFYCSFEQGAQGSYYAKYIDRLRLNQQITNVPWDPSMPVHTAWDLGVRDATSIIYFQYKNSFVNIIDVYENSKEGLEHYISVVNAKPYMYKYHIAPHDIRVREFTSGMSRVDKARQLGIEFTIAENISIMDGIEAVRTTLPRCYIDQVKCAKLIRALENYRQEWDDKRGVYKPMPVHDQYSHFSDSMRMLCVSLNKISDGSSAADLDRRFAQATGQGQSFGGFFG